ncbi:MAG TPA: NHL repeat-containing protein [Candidatus Eisenbacteria bacterium]|jgi:DNA-binding beta-propeller fold protein YncE
MSRKPITLENPGHRKVAATWLATVLTLACSSAAGGAPLLKPRQVIWGYGQGESFTRPSGVAFDPGDGALYVGNTGEHRIDVFSATGRPLCRFVHRVVRSDGSVVDGSPCALAFDRSGRLLVVDQVATYVDVLDRRGRFIARLDIAAGHPNAVAVAGDGTIFVGTTAEASKIYRFRPDLTPDGSWGEAGTDLGHLFNVTGLAVTADGAIAVACARTDQVIQIFTATGQYLRGFGLHDVGDGNFSLPSGVAATADGRIWVVDEIRQTLQVFDGEGTLVAKTGGRGIAPGEFAHPSSLASDERGLIALTDREIGRVQVFTVADQ